MAQSFDSLTAAQIAAGVAAGDCFSYGWRRIHNPDSGEDVADDLTTTEFTMAMLACRGWTNAEIARHMEVSPGTVKNRLSGVYAKLGIGTRAELVAHMLR